MTFVKVPHESAGSASCLCNTLTRLGIALGAALTALVSFSATSGSPYGAVIRTVFTDVLRWFGGAFAGMWAVMFRLPEQETGERPG
ncbi:hypothetical protein [Streptomyces chrestomyceticus]|uniref:hypothetical protein n=1 Tax=Streptomyces chrestomyceticus TaxID=68185 RepID=UPI0037BA2D56